MAKPNDKFEELARKAVARVDDSRELQQQLSLMPDEQVTAAGGDPKRGRGAGRAMSQMREWLASRGLRMPEDILTEMAGLDNRQHAFLATIADTEQLLAWAQAGAVGFKGSPAVQTMAVRISTFMQPYAMKLRAADALIPYGVPKATPDVTQTNVTNIIVPGATAPAAAPPSRPDLARDVTPAARRIGPPPMPHQMQQNQGLSGSRIDTSAATHRTDHETD